METGQPSIFSPVFVEIAYTAPVSETAIISRNPSLFKSPTAGEDNTPPDVKVTGKFG